MSRHTTADEVRNAMLAGLAIAKRTYANVHNVHVGGRDSVVLLSDADGSFLWSANVPGRLVADGNPGLVCRAVAEYAGRKLALSIVE